MLLRRVRKLLTRVGRVAMLGLLSHYTRYKMITKEQAMNSIENLNNSSLMESQWNRSLATECLSKYILQMDAIAARYNYLRNAPDSCEPDRVDVVVWTECDGGNMGDAIRGNNLDDYIDNEISKETK
jgi:hypothetical protein